MNCTIENPEAWKNLDLDAYAVESRVHGVLVCRPSHFDVVDVRNAHMAGHVGGIDRARALGEWEEMVATFRRARLVVEELPSEPGLVDMVFTANPCLTGVDRDGLRIAICSRMRHPERVPEVEHHKNWFRRAGVHIVELDFGTHTWEGGGDTIWHPARYVLWGGVGPRSERAAFEILSAQLAAPVALLELVDPAFYHLDTCLAVLDLETCAYVPAAFNARGRALITTAFPHALEVDEHEAREQLAGNLFCPDGHQVFLPAGSPVTRARLEDRDYHVIEIATGEYLKSGGSIYCMRQNLYG
ncbi:MAG: dimethylarginine dimethylaminohydrolase family protein [Planctomycetota bacterium]